MALPRFGCAKWVHVAQWYDWPLLYAACCGIFRAAPEVSRTDCPTVVVDELREFAYTDRAEHVTCLSCLQAMKDDPAAWSFALRTTKGA